MTYTDAIDAVNQRLGRIEHTLDGLGSDVGKVKENVAALAEHVAQQNGRVNKNEILAGKNRDNVSELLSGMREAAVERNALSGFQKLVTDKWLNIVIAVFQAIILAKLLGI